MKKEKRVIQVIIKSGLITWVLADRFVILQR